MAGKGFVPTENNLYGEDGLINKGLEQNGLSLRTENTAQDVGYGAEKVAEFFLPAGLVTKSKVAIEASHLPNALKLFATIGSQVGADTAVATAQGQSAKEIKDVGLISGGVELATGASGALLKTKLGQSAVKYMTEKIPSRLVNSIIRPNDKAFDFGRNPGLGVVQEGIVANSRAGLLAKIGLKKQDIGKQIGDTLISGENAAKSLDVQDAILNPIRIAKKQAVEAGDKALYSRLDDIEQGLTKEFDERFNVVGNKKMQLTPEEVQKLKIRVGKDTRWTGQTFDNDVNKVRVSIYRNLDGVLDDNVAGIADLNARYANMLTAEKNLERTDKRMQRLVMAGLRTTGVGTGYALYSGLSGDSGAEAVAKGIAAGAVTKFAGSTPAKTYTAQILNKLGQSEREHLFKLVPTLKNLYFGAKETHKQ
jgi:hypothetical protein